MIPFEHQSAAYPVDLARAARVWFTPGAPVQVAAQAFTFIMGGYETTASALAFAVHFVAQHPDVETKLLAEVDAFGRDVTPTYDSCDQVCRKWHSVDSLVRSDDSDLCADLGTVDCSAKMNRCS